MSFLGCCAVIEDWKEEKKGGVVYVVDLTDISSKIAARIAVVFGINMYMKKISPLCAIWWTRSNQSYSTSPWLYWSTWCFIYTAIKWKQLINKTKSLLLLIVFYVFAWAKSRVWILKLGSLFDRWNLFEYYLELIGWYYVKGFIAQSLSCCFSVRLIVLFLW